MIKLLIYGFLCTVAIFLLCCAVVVGTKSFCIYVKKYFEKPPQVEQDQPKQVKPRQPKTVKSIQIDADKVERIYFKKSS